MLYLPMIAVFDRNVSAISVKCEQTGLLIAHNNIVGEVVDWIFPISSFCSASFIATCHINIICQTENCFIIHTKSLVFFLRDDLRQHFPRSHITHRIGNAYIEYQCTYRTIGQLSYCCFILPQDLNIEMNDK